MLVIPLLLAFRDPVRICLELLVVLIHLLFDLCDLLRLCLELHALMVELTYLHLLLLQLVIDLVKYRPELWILGHSARLVIFRLRVGNERIHPLRHALLK